MDRVLDRALSQVIDQRLTLPQKRCWETLLFFAKPYLKTEDKFTVPLAAFIQKTKIPSCSIDKVKTLLSSIIKLPVKWHENDSGDSGVTSLIAAVQIINNYDLYWEYTPSIRELLACKTHSRREMNRH